MATSSGRVLLDGSRRPAPTVPRIAAAPPREPVRVSVVLRGAERDLTSLVLRLGEQPPETRQHLRPAQMRERFGARPADLEKVRLFARNHGLRISRVHVARRTVELAGPVAAMSAAFDVELAYFRSPNRVFRGRRGGLYLPAWLAGSVEGVFGLDTRAHARPHFAAGPPVPAAAPWEWPPGSRTVGEVARRYDFPAGGRGRGQTIALIQFGGGFRPADVKRFCATFGVRPVPRITVVTVDGAGNEPVGRPRSIDGKVAADLQIVCAVAPEARIVVYFAPNTARGYVDALKAAVHDPVHQPSVIALGWGRPETAWSGQSRRCVNSTIKEAVALGITVLAAAGDEAGAGFPAASPYAVACGGTTTAADGREAVWGAGGGVSRSGRAVPDVVGNADPATGYAAIVHGNPEVIGGTSAATSLYAGLIALVQEQTGRRMAPALRGPHVAGVGQAVTGDHAGLGRLRGTALLESVRGTARRLPALLRPGSVDPDRLRLVLTLLARDEADVIAANIEYHLAQGVDAIVVTDNRSADGTREIVEGYLPTGRVRLLTEDGEDFRQSDWVTRMARLASAELGADWVINADADEFWWPRSGSLKSVLALVPPGYATVTARRRNFLPVDVDGTEPFHRRMIIADPDSRTSNGAPLPPKVCHRGDPGVTVLHGNHHVLTGDAGASVDHGLLTVLHFPMRSYAQFERKVVVEATALARRSRSAAVGGNLGHLYESYLHGELPTYYRACALAPDEADQAIAAGLLERDERLARLLAERGLPAGPARWCPGL